MCNQFKDFFYLNDLKLNGDGANRDNISILRRVRLIVINGQIALILLAIFYLKIQLPVLPLAILLFIEIGFEFYCYVIVKQRSVVSSLTIFFHILFDSLVLALIIYLTGGANNPFITLLVLPVALGAFMLPPRLLLIVSVFQLVLYSLLNLYQLPLKLTHESHLNFFHIHLLGMWINFILTVILIAVFGLLTRNALLTKERKIQRMREKNLQDEQVLTLGIMSANAAHELATPLSTMAIVVDDLQHEIKESKTLQDIQLLQLQIINCKKIIKTLNNKSHNAQQYVSEEAINERLTDGFKDKLQSIIEQWLVYKPQIKINQNWQGDFSKTNILISLSMEQALTNLLDNAAEASLDNHVSKIELNVLCQNNQLVIEITDFGVGIEAEVEGTFSQKIQKTSKQNGLGWGMFLSNVSIERAGGSVSFSKAESGGTKTKIILAG